MSASLFFPGSKSAGELLQYRFSWRLGARRRGGRRTQLLSSLFPGRNSAQNVRDFSRSTIFGERFPFRHSLVPVGVLAGGGGKLAPTHLISEFDFIESPDDNPIRPAHLNDHGLILIAPNRRNRNCSIRRCVPRDKRKLRTRSFTLRDSASGGASRP
jgi:hypothetical protein